MFKQKFKAVFFDWDNTLVDAWPVLLKSTNEALLHFGLPALTLAEVKINARASTREGFPKQFGEKWQEAQDVFYKAVHTYSNELRLYDGVAEKLELLKSSNYKVAIISNKKNKILHEEIKQFNIPSDLVLGSGDTAYDKPHPEMGLIALNHFGLTSKEVIYVGDSITDWLFASNLNMPAIAIGDDAYEGQLLARFDSVNQPIDILLAS